MTVKEAVKAALKEHAEEHGCLSNCRFTDDDVIFFRRFKRTIDGFAYAIGLSIILGILGAIGWILKVGIEAWRKVGG